MSALVYTQYIFPAAQTVDGGAIQLRINRGKLGYAGDGNPAHTIILDNPFTPLEFGDIDKLKHDTDGDLCVDQVTVTLNDAFVITGRSNSLPVTHDLGAVLSSLLDEIFSTDDIYEVYLTYFGAAGGLETFFWGDVDPATIPITHKLIINEFTTQAQRQNEYQITVNSAAERLKDTTIAALISTIASTDVVKQTVFVGSTWVPDATGTAGVPTRVNALHYVWTTTGGANQTFPHAVNTIDFATMVNKIAAAGTFASGAIDTDMMFDFYKQTWDSGVTKWVYTKLTGDWSNIMVCYNFLFGQSIPDNSPDSVDVQWPCSIEKTQGLSELLKWIANQTGTFIETQLTNVGADVHASLVLRGRRTANGTLPTNFEILIDGSSEDPKQVAQSSVVLNMKADKMKVLVGPDANNAVSLEIPWRCHKWGSPSGNTFEPPYEELWWNHEDVVADQAYNVTCDMKPGSYSGTGSTKPTARGWVGGTMLLWQNGAGSQVYRDPGTFTLDLPASTAGAYAIAAILPKGVTTPLGGDEDCDGYFNPLWAYGQFYYHELVGTRIVFKQKYAGCKGDDGRIGSVKPGMRMQTYIHGSYRTFDAHEVKINVWQNTTEITWIEVPATFPLPNISVLSEAGSSTSTGSGSSTQNGGTGTNGGPYLAQSPTDPSVNTITPTTDIVGLTHQAIAGQTSDFEDWKNSSGVVIGKMDVNGKFTAKNLSASTLTTGIATVSSSGDISSTALTNGQLLIGSTGASPVAATLTAGANITITNTAGAITIAGTGSTGVTSFNGRSGAVVSQSGDYSFAMLSGSATLAQGGTGSASFTANTMIVSNAGATALVSGPAWNSGTSTITGNITGNAANVTGVVAVANGGSGQSSFTNGQLLIGNTTGNTLAKATLTAGTGISIANGAGSITISNTVTIPTDLVKTDPNSGGNVIQPTDTITAPLTLKQYTSGTTDVFDVTDSTSVYYFKINFQGIPSFAKRIDAVGGIGINGATGSTSFDMNGSFGTQPITKTGTYSLTANDHTVWADASGGAIGINLPTASTCTGREYCIKRINSGTNNVTVNGTIDGATSKTLTAQYQSVRVKSNGTTWYTV